MHVPAHITIPMPWFLSSAAQPPLSAQLKIREEGKEGFAMVGGDGWRGGHYRRGRNGTQSASNLDSPGSLEECRNGKKICSQEIWI